MITIVCPHCGQSAEKEAGAVSRARKIGAPLYCSRKCSGLGRRNGMSQEERRRVKAEYDVRYREGRRGALLEEKRAYHRRTYTPERGREYRKNRTYDHTAYCRRYYADPKKKQEKVEYDIKRQGKRFADFAEAWRVLIELEKEIRQRSSWYDRKKSTGYYDNINERKRHARQENRRIA